jgi:putative addiction module component (TIGR02574 family)
VLSPARAWLRRPAQAIVLVMAARISHVLDEALALSTPDRAELAAELLSSLDGPADADAEAAWLEEIKRRATRAVSGESTGIAREEVRARVGCRLSNL